MLFVPSERIRAITQGEVEWIKIVSCVELFCSELFVPSERIRAIGQGDCIVFCAIPLILLIVVEIKYLRML